MGNDIERQFQEKMEAMEVEVQKCNEEDRDPSKMSGLAVWQKLIELRASNEVAFVRMKDGMQINGLVDWVSPGFRHDAVATTRNGSFSISKAAWVGGEDEKDAWPGNPIEIKQIEVEPGEPDSYLIEVPSVAYEERVPDPWAWAEEVLAKTGVDVAAEIERIDREWEELNLKHSRQVRKANDIAAEMILLKGRKGEIVNTETEAEWIKPVRDVLLPRADAVREMLGKLGNVVVRVGLTSTNQVTWNWGSRKDGETLDQTGLDEEL